MATTRFVSTIADKGPLTGVNGANGSINPHALGLAARQLVAESQHTHSDPASTMDLQDFIRRVFYPRTAGGLRAQP